MFEMVHPSVNLKEHLLEYSLVIEKAIRMVQWLGHVLALLKE